MQWQVNISTLVIHCDHHQGKEMLLWHVTLGQSWGLWFGGDYVGSTADLNIIIFLFATLLQLIQHSGKNSLPFLIIRNFGAFNLNLGLVHMWELDAFWTTFNLHDVNQTSFLWSWFIYLQGKPQGIFQESFYDFQSSSGAISSIMHLTNLRLNHKWNRTRILWKFALKLAPAHM